jgi:diguanylate cyclase (GGDEF)-like protein/PAS domain S-box-containing protein
MKATLRSFFRRPSRFGLLAQLLAGFAAGGLFVTVLMVVGNSMLQHTSQRLVSMLEEHVHPLAQLHQLQSRIAALRNLELELATRRDVFAVQDHVTRMRFELNGVDADVQEFSTRLARRSADDAVRLIGHWQEYHRRLAQQMRLADEMDIAAVAEVTTSGSNLPFTAVQELLSEVAANTGAAADRAYQETVDKQGDQRKHFLILVMLGGAVIVAGLAYSGRMVVRRIRVLHSHAHKLAQGEDSGVVAISGHDEIGDLATAFTGMREQVLRREAALHAARLELEDRVEARTHDLRVANGQLVLFSQVVEQNPLGILIASIDGRIDYANDAYLRITGQPVSTLLGQPLAAAVQGGEPVDMAAAIAGTISGAGAWAVERQGQRADGSTYWERIHLALVHDQQGAPAHLLLSREDISERHAQQEKIAYQAHYDSLTALPNRALAQDRLLQTMEHCRREDCKAAALFLDLDNFKQINDTLGHATGDELLRQAANRLRALVRNEDTVARLGGDEFLIIISDLAHGDDVNVVAEKIRAAFATPFRVDERDLVTSPSIGIAIYPEDGSEPTMLLRNADMAMYEAKEAGRNTYRFFNGAMNVDALERLNLLGQLRGAVDRGEMALYFQPQINLKTGRLVGVETLIRWHHPEMGLVLPGCFIPLAEESGLMLSIGTWVLQEACRQAAAWQRAGLPPIVTAVNLSTVQFRSPDFLEVVEGALKDSGLEAAYLELELTESILIRDTEPVLERARQLKALGVLLSIDDFGTGYSSLSYLKRFPVDKLKIDQSFVRNMDTDTEDAALVHAIIHMARSLGLKTIAEGVETENVLRQLCDCHCDEAQGYFLGRPMPAADFVSYQQDQRTAPGLKLPSTSGHLARIA